MKRHLDPIAVNSLFLRMIIIFKFTCLIYRYEPTRKICSDCDVTRYHWRSYALTIAVGVLFILHFYADYASNTNNEVRCFAIQSIYFAVMLCMRIP